LKRRDFDASLEEPPDIVVSFEDSKIGIACKKLYSDRYVQNVLSQAVAQIEPTFDFGIVATNLDELVPPDQILRTPTQEAMSQYIDGLNSHFFNSHERHFRKYLGSGRLISAFISTGVLADVYRARTRLNYARQSTIWAISGLPPDTNRQRGDFDNDEVSKIGPRLHRLRHRLGTNDWGRDGCREVGFSRCVMGIGNSLKPSD